MIVRLVPALLVTSALTAAAFADDVATIEKWYAALGKADGPALEKLLTPDAVIDLQDIGTSQTRAEFIDSMGEWETAMEEGNIRYKADGMVGAAYAYKVCYDFADNDVMTRELFVFADGLISKNEQTSIADNCDKF